MQGCCSSWLQSPGWDAEHSFQRCKCSPSTHSAEEQRRWRAAPWAAPAYANSTHKCGAAQRVPSSMHTPPQKIGLQLRRCPGLWWSEPDQPRWLTSSLLTWGWSFFSPFSCASWMKFILHMNSSLSFLLSPHSYPCFFLLLLLVLLSPYSNIPRLPQYFGPYTELLIQFPRQHWSCMVVLTQETLILPLQSSVMFGHCSYIPTISTCGFQQSFWVCSSIFSFCLHLLCPATSVTSCDVSCPPFLAKPQACACFSLHPLAAMWYWAQ